MAEEEFEQVGITKCPLCNRQNLSWNIECTWCGCELQADVSEENNQSECVA